MEGLSPHFPTGKGDPGAALGTRTRLSSLRSQEGGFVSTASHLDEDLEHPEVTQLVLGHTAGDDKAKTRIPTGLECLNCFALAAPERKKHTLSHSPQPNPSIPKRFLTSMAPERSAPPGPRESGPCKGCVFMRNCP